MNIWCFILGWLVGIVVLAILDYRKSRKSMNNELYGPTEKCWRCGRMTYLVQGHLAVEFRGHLTGNNPCRRCFARMNGKAGGGWHDEKPTDD